MGGFDRQYEKFGDDWASAFNRELEIFLAPMRVVSNRLHWDMELSA